MNWPRLKRDGRRRAEQNGHDLENFKKLSHCLWFAHCRRCTAYVRIGGAPNVSGDALEKQCNQRTQRTP